MFTSHCEGIHKQWSALAFLEFFSIRGKISENKFCTTDHLVACIQMSPISFASCVPFPHEAKEIRDDCMQTKHLVMVFVP